MKSLASFLLLENLLYNVPSGMPRIKALANNLFTPEVILVEEDCGQNVGLRNGTAAMTRPLDPLLHPTYVGKAPYVYLTKLDDSTFTSTELVNDLAAGINTVFVRHSGHCNSTGGICQSCFYANLIQSTADFLDSGDDHILFADSDIPPLMADVEIPAIGSKVRLRSKLGHVKPFFQPSERAYFAYLSSTYSGAILGTKAFDDFPMPVKPSLANSLINKNLLDRCASDLASIKEVPGNYVRYIDDIEDSLEKALCIVILYCVYGSSVSNEFPTSFERAPDIYMKPT